MNHEVYVVSLLKKQVTMWNWVSVGLVGLLIVFRWLFPERPMDYIGPRAFLDSTFALGLLGIILLLAGGLGQKTQRWLKLEGLTHFEQAVFGLPIGLGILAYGVMALGLVGLLHSWAILLWLVAVALWTWREWGEIVNGLPTWWKNQRWLWHRLSFGKRLFLLIGSLIFAFTLVQALTPPWGYDGLMYHLHGPKLFLQAERILLLPDTWANYPFTLQMLYTLGMAFGSDIFAKLLHLTFGVFLVLATFCVGQRYIGRTGGWIATAILLGMPILPFWASLAYGDMVGVYDFLAVYALILWQKKQQRQWLILAGLMIGWALGSRYLSLGGFGVLGLWLLWYSRDRGIKELLMNSLFFGLTAILLASPWYIKNWLLSGNPIFPFVFGGQGWTQERLDLFNAYQLNSFGTGRGFLDYILLPLNLFIQRGKFAGLDPTIELPHFLFLLVLLYPWFRSGPGMNTLASLTTLRFVVWAVGPQQFRFLLPLLPAFSLLATTVLFSLTNYPRTRRLRRVLITGLVGGMLIVTLIYQALLFFKISPLNVVLGREPKDVFLTRSTQGNYSALQVVQQQLGPEERVMLMWDGRGYYCDHRCLPDIDQSQWTRLALAEPDAATVANRLCDMQVSHLYLRFEEVNWFFNHDPTGQHRQAIEFFINDFQPNFTQEVYRDEWARLFKVICK
ncbi:ArnT family glycosyltransferase [Chloroflexota bacterium]